MKYELFNFQGCIFFKDEKSLDHETTDEYSLNMMAYDNPKFGSPRFSSTLVKIIVKDVNDNAPIFKSGKWYFIVYVSF